MMTTPTPSSWWIAPALLALLAAALPACGGKQLQLPADSAGTPLLERGNQALEEEDWRDAVDAFDTLLKNYPASPHLAEARVGLGRAYYAIGRNDTLILAIDAFQNFLTYHPTHPNVDFAQFMIGKAYAKRMRSPDRDQSNTREAVEAFQTFLREYPDSAHVEEAREELNRAVDRLAAHELEVAEWQLDNGHPGAARDRARYALERYPETGLGCDLKFVLAEALVDLGEWARAATHYQEIVERYPQCQYATDARKRLERRPGTEVRAGVDGST